MFSHWGWGCNSMYCCFKTTQRECHMTTDSSPACLSSRVGQWVLCSLRSQVPLLGPFPPAHQTRQLNIQFGQIWKVLVLLDKLSILTFCPSIPGKPIAPCRWRRAHLNTTLQQHSNIVTLCLFERIPVTDKLFLPCRLSLRFPRDHLENPEEEDGTVLPHFRCCR